MNRSCLLLLLQLVATFARQQPLHSPRFRAFQAEELTQEEELSQEQEFKQLLERATENANAKNPIAMAVIKPLIKKLVKKLVGVRFRACCLFGLTHTLDT